MGPVVMLESQMNWIARLCLRPILFRSELNWITNLRWIDKPVDDAP